MKKINWDKVKKLLKNEKTKPIAFFAFYFVFFLALAILFRMNPTTTDISTKKQNTKSTSYYNLGKLEDANYHFKYDYNINNNIFSYEGDKNGLRELFTLNNNNNVLENYYSFRNLYMKQVNNVWEKSNNPYLYPEFLQIDNIKKILEKATFMSKTEYQNKKYSYNYQITTNTLEEIIGNNIIDIADIPNEITITMDENYYVENIKYNLSNYAKFKDPNINIVSMELDYSDFGNIKEIEEPRQ